MEKTSPISDIFGLFVEGDSVCFKDMLYLFTYFNGEAIVPVSYKFDLTSEDRHELAISTPKYIKKALAVAVLNEKHVI